MKSTKAITLVALIVTIVILLILAGISINFIFGADGIFTKSKYAVEKYKKSQEDEQKMLNEVANYITDGYMVGGRGEAKTEMKKFGSTDVPIPGGFYYVGGNLDTGIVISDDKDDENKGDSFAIALNLKGNQFVWIPCKVTDGVDNEYKKSETSGVETPQGVERTDVIAENPLKDENYKNAVAKYGGFYVARYEAGLATTTQRYTTGKKIWNDNVYNDIGKPLSKAKQIPWNYIDYPHAWANSLNMYASTPTVVSSLITGTQWDVMLNVMKNKGKKFVNSEEVSMTENDIKIDSGAWGNYKNQTFSYTGEIAEYNNNGLSAFSAGNGTKSSGMYLLTTGASERTKIYNIFDVAGNLWEWTTESKGSNRDRRGGCFVYDSNLYTGIYCAGDLGINTTSYDIGFRVVLYVL